MKAQVLSPLPDGLFTHFQGMRTFFYKTGFKFNKTNPTNSFWQQFEKGNLKITKWRRNLTKL
jgi:hypothetical protein